MASADRRLREQGLVEVEKGEEGWFQMTRMHKGMIADDHLPVGPGEQSAKRVVIEGISELMTVQFLNRGVSILHVISNPFPSVWHSLAVSRVS
jgi:hypothetical protein